MVSDAIRQMMLQFATPRFMHNQHGALPDHTARPQDRNILRARRFHATYRCRLMTQAIAKTATFL